MKVRGRSRQRGANLVEAAFTLLLFLTSLFAIFDFARCLSVSHAMTDAAREGARYAVAPFGNTGNPPTAGQVTTLVQTYLSSAGIDAQNAAISISVNPTLAQTVNGVPLQYTQVTVSGTYTFIILPFSIPLSATSVMRNENN